LLNTMRSQLVELETQYKARVSILVRQAVPDKEITVEGIKEEFAEAPPAEAAAVSQPLPALAIEAVASPMQEVAEEETAKPAKKSGRRRRRTKKKTDSAGAEEAQDLELENVPLVEEEILSGETEGSGVRAVDEASVDAEAAAGAEDFDAVLETVISETSELPEEKVEEKEPVEDHEAALADEVAKEPSVEEQGQSVRGEQPDEAATAEKPQEEQSGNSTRKSVLQRFLPFF